MKTGDLVSGSHGLMEPAGNWKLIPLSLKGIDYGRCAARIIRYI